MSRPARALPPPSDAPPLPVDQRLVRPGERFEILDGKVIAVPPSHEPHGDRHSKLQALLEAHVAAAYNVACDMLTRVGPVSDIAPDASVYPSARDAATGGRQLEELAFEVLGRQSRGVAATKADRLLGRGVRRVFALDVGRRLVLERQAGQWVVLAAESAITDPALAVALPVAALADAAKVDDAVAAALLSKGNPVLVAHSVEQRAEGLREGEAKGKAEAVLAVLEARGLAVTATARRRVLACRDLVQLDAWLRRAAVTASVRALFD